MLYDCTILKATIKAQPIYTPIEIISKINPDLVEEDAAFVCNDPVYGHTLDEDTNRRCEKIREYSKSTVLHSHGCETSAVPHRSG